MLGTKYGTVACLTSFEYRISQLVVCDLVRLVARYELARQQYVRNIVQY